MTRWADEMGATFHKNFTDNTTVLLVTPQVWKDQGPTVLKALAKKPPCKVLDFAWYGRCTQLKKRVTYKDYEFKQTDKQAIQDRKQRIKDQKAAAKEANKGVKTGRPSLMDSFQDHTGSYQRSPKPFAKRKRPEIVKPTNTDRSDTQPASDTESSSVPKKRQRLKRVTRSSETSISSLYHTYQDKSGFIYDIALIKTDASHNANRRINLVLWESNDASQPRHYACISTLNGTGIGEGQRTVHAKGASFSTAFRRFQMEFRGKTGINWQERTLLCERRKTVTSSTSVDMTNGPGPLRHFVASKEFDSKPFIYRLPHESEPQGEDVDGDAEQPTAGDKSSISAAPRAKRPRSRLDRSLFGEDDDVHSDAVKQPRSTPDNALFCKNEDSHDVTVKQGMEWTRDDGIRAPSASPRRAVDPVTSKSENSDCQVIDRAAWRKMETSRQTLSIPILASPTGKTPEPERAAEAGVSVENTHVVPSDQAEKQPVTAAAAQDIEQIMPGIMRYFDSAIKTAPGVLYTKTSEVADTRKNDTATTCEHGISVATNVEEHEGENPPSVDVPASPSIADKAFQEGMVKAPATTDTIAVEKCGIDDVTHEKQPDADKQFAARKDTDQQVLANTHKQDEQTNSGDDSSPVQECNIEDKQPDTDVQLEPEKETATASQVNTPAQEEIEENDAGHDHAHREVSAPKSGSGLQAVKFQKTDETEQTITVLEAGDISMSEARQAHYIERESDADKKSQGSPGAVDQTALADTTDEVHEGNHVVDA